MRDILEKNIGLALVNVGAQGASFSLDYPSDFSFGEYATNAALVAAKELKKTPRECALLLVQELNHFNIPHVSRIEIAGPGFINFHIAPEFFSGLVSAILRDEREWGTNSSLKGKRLMVEYTDPNPFKEFHIGHLMSNAIGESVSRLLAGSGAEVKRVNYEGDVGIHVAKAIWGMLRQVEGTRDAAAWGRAYALGSASFEEDPKAKREMQALNKKIYERGDEAINRLYDEGRKVSLDHFEELYRALGTHFDFYFFESDVWRSGVELVKNNIGKVFEESDGAVVFRGEKVGLHTRVFINSEGIPTYEAKELALSSFKQKEWQHDRSIVITASEINDYFRVVKAALHEIDPETAEKIVHMGHGFLKLPSGKMSSRKGSVVTGESLLLELKDAVFEKMAGRDLPEGERTEIAETVAVAAIKYVVLKQTAGKDIIFEKEKSLSFEGDSGPYLQYARVRACSVLAKAEGASITPDVGASRPNEVSGVERLLSRFPEAVARSAREYDPHHVATYLTELAGAFNSYYAKEKIVDMSPEAPYKVALTKAFEITMRNGLSFLGIKAPDRM